MGQCIDIITVSVTAILSHVSGSDSYALLVLDGESDCDITAMTGSAL